jgi:hypothetical protein
MFCGTATGMNIGIEYTMNQQASDPEETAQKHKVFDELYDAVDAALRGLGAPDGISPQPDEPINVAFPPDRSETVGEWKSCDLDGFCVGDKELLGIDITVGPLRIGRSRGKKREEVTVEVTWDNRDPGETGQPIPKSRKIIFTAARDENHRDLWVFLHELKLRWSVYHGFVKHDLGGVFRAASLPSNVDDITRTKLIYSLTLMISELIDVLGKIRKRNEKGLIIDF